MDGGISVWVPVISAGAGIAGALGSQWVLHIFITRREKRASEEKQVRERYFIASELVFLLERFAAACAEVCLLSGDESDPDLSVTDRAPVLSYAAVEGDWRALPVAELFRLYSLPVMRDEAELVIRCAADYGSGDFRALLECCQYQYARLGLRAQIIASRLRKLAGLPSRLSVPGGVQVMSVLRNCRRRLLRTSANLNRSAGGGA